MLALLLATALAAAPQSEPRPAVFINAETCLRENVGVAVAASAGAADAADFLLSYLCAGPVERAAAWQRNTDMLAGMQGMFEGMDDLSQAMEMTETVETLPMDSKDEASAAPEETEAEAELADDFSDMFGGLEGVSVDPVTGELVVAEGASSMMASTLRTQTGALSSLMGDQRPAFLRELAGRLVLEARRRR